jgi:predicted hydrocarbon binding protein
MYGIVNKAIEEMAVASGGRELWQKICAEASCDDTNIVSMQHYPDENTFRLVEAASNVLGIPAHVILRKFGKHWILYTGQQGFGPMMKVFGTTVRSFLGNLDAMHSSILNVMPKMQPPRIGVEEIDEHTITVHYVSSRDGLAPMVEGLLEGLGEKFNEPLEVRQTVVKADGYDHDEFEVKFI